MKIKLLLIIIVIISYNSKMVDAVELDSILENSTFLTRYKKQSTDYSYMFLNSFNSKNRNDIFDFSFETPIIKVGRIKKMGIWKELFNPLNSTANSDIFHETIGFEKDFSFNRKGLYGLSLNLKEGTGISLLLPESIWLGGNYTFNTGPLDITLIASVSGLITNSTDKWTGTFPIIPETIPMHIGLHSIYNYKTFKLDYLAALSGSTIYKAGNFNRLFLEISTDTLNLKASYGEISPYFISPEGKSSTIHYHFSFWTQINLYKYWQTIIKSNYSKDQEPILPVAYIPAEGSSSLCLIYDNSKFNFYTDFGQNFNYDYYGTEFVENSIDLKAGYSNLFSISGSFGLVFNFKYLIERKYELILGLSIKKIDLNLSLKHIENSYEADQNLMRIKINTELVKGNFYTKIEIGDNWKPENFTLGLKTKF